MEAHSYHGAFVIQSCDKMPLAVVSALAHLDTLRRLTGRSAGDRRFRAGARAQGRHDPGRCAQ